MQNLKKYQTSLNSKADTDDTEAVLPTKTNSTDFEEINDRLKKLEAQERERQMQAVMRESYEKRMNILIHGLPENIASAWETRETTKSIIYLCMRDGLKIEDPQKIIMADYHRLPQRPIFNPRKRICRPVIIKFTNAASDKHTVFSHVKNLKRCNEARRLENLQPQYVTEHLPKKFVEERKKLMPAFKEARLQSKKTVWRVENGHYTLYIDNQRAPLPMN